MDVVAVGLVDGRMILHNLKLDETIFHATQDWGPVTSISFRADGPTFMATGSMEGHVSLWNLEDRKMEHQITKAHFATVTGLQFLPNEPLLVTSSLIIPSNSGYLISQMEEEDC